MVPAPAAQIPGPGKECSAATPPHGREFQTLLRRADDAHDARLHTSLKIIARTGDIQRLDM
jgi:hypothetical protein